MSDRQTRGIVWSGYEGETNTAIALHLAGAGALPDVKMLSRTAVQRNRGNTLLLLLLLSKRDFPSKID